ncbi:hypothetical protein HWV03_16140 [Moritella sp. 36]|nr:hypothetical protein HWV02_16525 [Moritella sp. 28]QUM90221.1 hypothetical protein HWV03_16140 [Moritella sp. 36]
METVAMDSKERQHLDETCSEQEKTQLIIRELNEQIKRMTDYVEQHSQSYTTALYNTLKATIRYRDSLVASLARQT